MVILAAATATVHRSSAAAVAAAWAPSSSTSLLTESLCTPLLARRRRASILQQATSSRARAPAARCQSCRGIYTGGSAVAVTSQARSLKDSGRSQSRPVSRTTAGSQRYFSSWSDRRGALHAGILQPGQSSRSLSTNTGGGQAPGKKGKGNKGKGRATNGPSTQPRRDLPRRDWNAVPRNANQSSIPVASPSASSSSSPKPAVSTAAVKEDRSPAGRRSASRKQQQQIFLPAVISVSNLARLLGVKMRSLQQTMLRSDLSDSRPDAILQFSDAELLALEYNLEAVANDEAAFDIYPRPPPSTDTSSKPLPLRPPIVTIMGHVDHGKTTLLDTLRKTAVAQGEAGGITQHVGAFSVAVGSSSSASASDAGKDKSAGGYDTIKTVTFLDTPGHAAFTAMRSRGASVTDIIVLVVAADDGVMPQTEEVIALWKELSDEAGTDTLPVGNQQQRKKASSAVQLVVALNKMDKPDADPERVKRELLSAGVELEEFGGEVPCVEVSGKTGDGLDLLEETLATLAELAELRAEKDGPAEGYVIESRVEKGRGNLATVLVKRGALSPGDCIIAGTSWAKVRQIFDGAGKIVKKAFPGDPVLVTGWRDLPIAGEEMLGSTSESDVKRAIANRKEMLSRQNLVRDAEVINDVRRQEAEEVEKRKRTEYEDRVRRRAIRAGDKVDPTTGKAFVSAADALQEGSGDLAGEEGEVAVDAVERKELLLVVKADFTGTVEAVIGAIQNIGNNEAGVKIVASGVGEPNDSDIARAHAGGGHVLGFNVEASNAIQKQAARLTPPVKIHCDTVIYRLMDHVSKEVAALLPPKIEMRVTGEASVAQTFQINIRSRLFRNIAGCRVTNGVVARNTQARLLRGPEREVVFEGKVDTLKHVKKDVEEMRKGTECGIGFDGFEDIKPDDVVQCYTTVEVPRTL